MIPQPALLVMSMPDLLIIVVLGLLFFGGKKLGDVGKGLGDGIRNFKSAISGEKSEEEKEEAQKSDQQKKPA